MRKKVEPCEFEILGIDPDSFGSPPESSLSSVIDKIISERRKLGDLCTGNHKIDDRLGFRKGDLVTVQSMTNHGKTTFMVQLVYQFLSLEENLKVDPMCIFVTYESGSTEVREKFVDVISCAHKQKPISKLSLEEQENGCGESLSFYKRMCEDDRICVMENVVIEELEELIDAYQEKFPKRTLVLFLDHFQIIENSLEGTIRERNILMAIKLRTLAEKKKILIFTSSQVNDKRQTRGGLELHNASAIVLDIVNHSHILLNPSPLIMTRRNFKKLYKKPVDGNGVCSFSAIKNKHAPTFSLEGFFLFDGFFFRENPDGKLLGSKKNKGFG